MSKNNLITPSFADEAPLGVDSGVGHNKHGLICAANESRFVSGNFNEPLTALSVGWKDPENIDQILQRLAPAVLVPNRFSFRKADNAQAFLSETDDLRPIGSPFKTVGYSGTEVEARTYNRGLSLSIDHDEVDDLEGEVSQAVGRLRQRLARNSLRRLFVLLDTADTNDTAVWGASSNPDAGLRAMAKACADAIGILPNVFAIGELAWHYRLDSYETAARVNGQQRANLTPDQLAQYLMADVVEVVKARFQSTATVKSAVLVARIYAYLAMQGASKDDPSSVKRFVSNGSSGGFGVYRKDEAKFTVISVEHYENQVATGLGIQSLDITQGSDL